MRLNHQLFPLFAIVYFFFIVSCNPTGELSQTHTTINSESPIDNSAKDTVEVPINIDTSFSVGQYNTKDKYKIAVLLPFSIDRERLLYFDPDAHERTYQPYIALEFYEGMLMALDSLKKQGANIDLHTWDYGKNLYDSIAVKRSVTEILNQPEMKTMDLIIGPIDEFGLKEVARFSLQEHIHFVSPLNHFSNLPQPGFRYFTAAPSMATKVLKFCEYTTSHFESASVTYLINSFDSTHPVIDTVADFFSAPELAERFSFRNVKADYKMNTLLSGLNTKDTNIILNFSNDEVFVNALFRVLNQRYHKSVGNDNKATENFVVIGTKSWLNFESIPIDYFSNLNFHHISTAPKFDSLTTIHMNSSYYSTYHSIPSEYVLAGFTLLKYFGHLLNQYGLDFPLNLEKSNHPYSHYSPTLGNKKYFENPNVKIIRYEQSRMISN